MADYPTVNMKKPSVKALLKEHKRKYGKANPLTQEASTRTVYLIQKTSHGQIDQQLPHQHNKYMAAAMEIAELVNSKQKAYGDSFGKSGQIMRILYPDGIPLNKIDDALTIVRIIDKLFRVATAKDALGESPYKDILGYSLLAVVRDVSRIDSLATSSLAGERSTKKGS